MGSACVWCCGTYIFVISIQAWHFFGSRCRIKQPHAGTTWDQLGIQLCPDTCLLHRSYRCKATPRCKGEKGILAFLSRSLLCISLAVWANVYWFFICKKKRKNKPKNPVSCTPSQGGVHALLITASLQKIPSDREHTVVLNHPPLSKRSHRSSWEAATWLLRPFHTAAASVLGFGWKQCWALLLPAAEAGTIPPCQGTRDLLPLMLLLGQALLAAGWGWSRGALPGDLLAGVPVGDGQVPLFRIDRSKACCTCRSVSLQRFHNCNSGNSR